MQKGTNKKAQAQLRLLVEGLERYQPAQSKACTIRNSQNEVIFHLPKVKAPKSWSDSAIEIAASKYFRRMDRRKIESSIYQLLARIGLGFLRALEVSHYQKMAKRRDAKSAFDFVLDLQRLCLEQKIAFNSPVWFNCGLSDAYGMQSKSSHYIWDSKKKSVQKIEDAFLRPQLSACFIQSVEDSLESIFELVQNEAKIFKFGSGSGTNFSKLRSKYDQLKAGGTSSGLLSFLEVLDKSAGAIKSGGVTRRAAKMVCVDVSHPEILDFITWKQREEKKAHVLIANGYSGALDGEAYHTVSGQNANNSVRMTDAFMKAVEKNIKSNTKKIRAHEIWNQIVDSAHACADPGLQFHDTINAWHTCAQTSKINASNPCSEYMFIDDSSCNLASLNLAKFLKTTDFHIFDSDSKWELFDWTAFREVCAKTFQMQEHLIDFSSYPTQKIAQNSHDYRPIGLGFANLGGLLMRLGIAYDSEEGRAWAAAITATMTGEAYLTSAGLAKDLGPFSRYKENKKSMLRVMRKHQSAVKRLNGLPIWLKKQITGLWQAVIQEGERHGFRNAQATVIAPTGTIGFVMDCETTGIEPDYSLIKYKSLVGGGQLITENKAIRHGLTILGYAPNEIEAILKFVRSNNSVVNAPFLREEHLGVFATAVGENMISPMGHLKMLAAVQPFVSGAISKTVNLPNSFTREQLNELYFAAWKMGLKSIAIYRDGSKFAQPLSDKRKTEEPHLKSTYPKCGVCGFDTILDGGCFKCLNCGSTTACAG